MTADDNSCSGVACVNEICASPDGLTALSLRMQSSTYNAVGAVVAYIFKNAFSRDPRNST